MREVYLGSASDIRRAIRQLNLHLRRVEKTQEQQDLERWFEIYAALRRSQTCDATTQTEQVSQAGTEEIPSATEAMSLQVAIENLKDAPAADTNTFNQVSATEEYDPEHPEMGTKLWKKGE